MASCVFTNVYCPATVFEVLNTLPVEEHVQVFILPQQTCSDLHEPCQCCYFLILWWTLWTILQKLLVQCENLCDVIGSCDECFWTDHFNFNLFTLPFFNPNPQFSTMLFNHLWWSDLPEHKQAIHLPSVRWQDTYQPTDPLDCLHVRTLIPVNTFFAF